MKESIIKAIDNLKHHEQQIMKYDKTSKAVIFAEKTTEFKKSVVTAIRRLSDDLSGEVVELKPVRGLKIEQTEKPKQPEEQIMKSDKTPKEDVVVEPVEPKPILLPQIIALEELVVKTSYMKTII